IRASRPPGTPGERGLRMGAHIDRPGTLLARATLFAGLDIATLGAIEAVAQPRYYTAGKIICRQGEPSDSLFILRRGFARAFVAPASGSAATLGARVPAGQGDRGERPARG